MLCPRCHDAFLDEVEREGVIVDVCRKCRGAAGRGELTPSFNWMRVAGAAGSGWEKAGVRTTAPRLRGCLL